MRYVFGNALERSLALRWWGCLNDHNATETDRSVRIRNRPQPLHCRRTMPRSEGQQWNRKRTNVS